MDQIYVCGEKQKLDFYFNLETYRLIFCGTFIMQVNIQIELKAFLTSREISFADISDRNN